MNTNPTTHLLVDLFAYQETLDLQIADLEAAAASLVEAEEHLRWVRDGHAGDFGVSATIHAVRSEAKRLRADQALVMAWVDYGIAYADRLAREHLDALAADPSLSPAATGALRELAPLLAGFDIGALPSLSDEEAQLIAGVVAAAGLGGDVAERRAA